MSKHAAKRLKQFEVLGRNFLDKTEEIVKDAEAAELKAKESETKALKGKRQMQALLNKIIPREIISQLGNGISIQPQVYENVTICILSISDYNTMTIDGNALQVPKCFILTIQA